jgi:succinate dehydrogenase/fumarate reductase flavoprotein subunit
LDVNEHAGVLEWPYPVSYGKETQVSADVLVLGGGIAGCHAAISAAKRGSKVIVVEKGCVLRSGSGGAGVDHWHGACTNPASKITPDELMELTHNLNNGYTFPEYGNEISAYILLRESWDALRDAEDMGVQVRDVDDEFVGAEFRDDATKLMFAYDYDNRHCIRVQGGADIKVALAKELKRLGVEIYDRVMVTSLLNEGGETGARVIGATGLHTRTGEFFIFKAKASIVSMGAPTGLWVFSTELCGGAATHGDPNNAGEAVSMAWAAGAELALMERSGHHASGGFTYPAYGTGNAHNTWYPCTVRDANGREIPWVDRDGKVLETVAERCQPAAGQRIFIHGVADYELRGPSLIPDLSERIAKGEYALPLYADLPGMPEHERRAIWGLMLYNEGKTKIIFDTYQAAGFDPDKDLLQVSMMPPDLYSNRSWTAFYGAPHWRGEGFNSGSGILFDWDLKSSLEGLYVAGQSTYAGSDHAGAACTGRYAGRKAVEFAKTAQDATGSRAQIDNEKNRVYAPVRRSEGIGWKELRAGVARIMQDYCGAYKSEETLTLGLEWLASITEGEASRVCARNPHELMRAVECLTRMKVGEVIMHASLNRKASSSFLAFQRLDYPEVDPEDWNKLVTIRLEDGGVKVGERPVDYGLLPPNAPTYAENYEKHCYL